ncbi:MAG: hypothetical protein MJ237_03585, partial [bacterium]|nr:hypothetical protein [bacterium]
MTDTDDLTVINENFDTIKTLLNSIRAQGILNTSDVDKLLNGINSKLEKINTDEDIDIIKVFLSELKQNLDERHGVIVSKFGAIESLFSNLLKNSNELPKSDDLKKLFDVVATNISVFSREIVSQKESLTDIMLRIDAMRSDDTVKKDIIKNIALLKPDLERVSNGFDTIVLSLNDNFKTVVKTITSLDNPELIEKLSVGLNEMKMSTNTLLSAIDVIDKKADSIDVLIKDLVTKSDLMDTEKAIGEIKVLNQDISSNIVDISDRYNKIDNLAEKIDASVSIIAELKSTLENNEKEDTEKLLTNIEELSNKVENIKTDIQFEEFIGLLTSTLKEFEVKNVRMSDELKSLAEGLLQLSQLYKTIDINTSTQNITDAITSTEATIKNFVSEGIEKITEYDNSKILQLMDSFSSMADELQAKFNKSQSEISVFCDNRFGNIFDNVSELKVMVSQIDDNSISANNAIFSNISDRLDIFENTLRDALSTQETNANDASVKLFEQIDNIKNLSGVLDYKVDSSVLEISNLQNEFLNLKTAVNDVLALNFVETVKDLRADLYASKQDISTILEDSSSAVTEKLSNDLFSKYELVISKLDAIDDSFVKTQRAVLEDVKDLLGKMSSSVVDILSYVSETKSNDNGELETKIEGIEHALKENNLEYIENVKAIVDTIRDQVVSVLEVNGEKSNSQLNSLVSLVDKNSANIQEDIKNSYEKLNDILASYQELSKQIDISQSANNSNYGSLMTLANNINSDFEKKLSAVKNSLLEKIDTYKQEFSCENADKINEFKLSMDNISNKNSQCVFEILDEIKSLFKNLSAESAKERENAFNSVATDFLNLKDLLSTQANNNIESRNAISKNLTEQLDKIQTNIQTLETNIGNGRENALEKIAGLVGRLEVYINDINNKNIAQKEADNEIVLGAINELKSFIDNTNFQNSQDSDLGLNTVLDSIEGIKSVLEEVVNISSQSNFETLAEITEELRNLIASTEDNTADAISAKLERITEELRTFITSTEDNTVDAISAKLERITEELRT